MNRDLPPLNALRTFEAAARHGNFTSAARELHVTHGAVSRAVATLQDWLGVPLFRRAGRGIELTGPARAYVAEIASALDRIAEGTRGLRARCGSQELRVVAPPTLTVRWLIPRLPRFYAKHPEVAVRVRTAAPASAVGEEEFDIAIRRGPGRWPGLRAHRFLGEDATPVASPGLLRKLPLRSPADLRRHTLIHAEARADAWDGWLRAFAPPRLRPAGELRFDHVYLALQAAVDGLGLAMGPQPVIAEDLAAGRLVAPFGDRVLGSRGFFALTHGRLDAAPRPVQAFVGWLGEEAERR